jgi:cytochrome c oxidase subunit IV
MATFQNPANGYTEETNAVLSVIAALFFGLIYFAIKGLWRHSIAIALIAFLSISTLGIVGVFLIVVPMWFVYACIAPHLIRAAYLRRGWIEVGTQSSRNPPAPVEKTCPECAERVKAAANKCRFCGHHFEARAAT